MPTELCVERANLSRAVVDAITESYRAKGDYDKAKQKQAANVDALATALLKARAEERAAERALREHVEQDGCKL
jgi:hypothetical protein